MRISKKIIIFSLCSSILPQVCICDEQALGAKFYTKAEGGESVNVQSLLHQVEDGEVVVVSGGNEEHFFIASPIQKTGDILFYTASPIYKTEGKNWVYTNDIYRTRSTMLFMSGSNKRISHCDESFVQVSGQVPVDVFSLAIKSCGIINTSFGANGPLKAKFLKDNEGRDLKALFTRELCEGSARLKIFHMKGPVGISFFSRRYIYEMKARGKYGAWSICFVVKKNKVIYREIELLL